MGYIYVDNRLDGGAVQEWDTVACRHCQAVIKIVIQGCTRAYATDYRCARCTGPVCKRCARLMHANGGSCTSHFLAKIDAALRSGRWMNDLLHHYRTS